MSFLSGERWPTTATKAVALCGGHFSTVIRSIRMIDGLPFTTATSLDELWVCWVALEGTLDNAGDPPAVKATLLRRDALAF